MSRRAVPFPLPPSPFPRLSYPPQMPSHAARASEESDQSAERHDRRRLLAREERRLEQISIDDEIGHEREPDRHDPAEQSLDRPLQQERAANEAVGGAD